MRIDENVENTLEEVYTKVMGLERIDYASPAKAAKVSNWHDRYNIELPVVMEGISQARQRFNLTDYAQEQLNQRWTGFNTFSRELKKRQYDDLYLRTLNELLQRDERKVIVRTIKPNGDRLARAVVSDSFKPIDDCLIMPEMLDIIGREKDTWRALGGGITDTNTMMKFISREPQIHLRTEGRVRPLHIGFMYRNSEVGRGYAQFSAFFFDSFCENGCVFGKITVADVKFMHRGSKIMTDFGQIFEERIQSLELAQIKGAVVDATRLVCEGRYIPKIRGLLEGAISREIPSGQVADVLKEVGKRAGLSDTEVEQAKIRYDGTNNQFGIQAAITNAARDVGSYTRRIELEEAGGQILQMSSNTWDSILALTA